MKSRLKDVGDMEGRVTKEKREKEKKENEQE